MAFKYKQCGRLTLATAGLFVNLGIITVERYLRVVHPAVIDQDKTAQQSVVHGSAPL